jgi:hypothetical protein
LGIIKAWASIDLFAPARLPYGLVYIARLPPGTVWGILRVLDSGFVDVENQAEDRRSFLQMSAILYNLMSAIIYKLLSFRQM